MDYAVALIEQNELLGTLIRGADPTTPVPSCPGWTLRQLVRHVGRGDRWAGQIVRDRMDAPLDPRAVRDGKPPADPEGELAWLTDSPKVLLEAVADAGAEVPVWTFLGPKPAAWWIRRRLHESVVHRADVALALGVGYHAPPALAADALSEYLDLIAESRDLGAGLDDGHSLHLHATDEGLGPAGEWLVRAGPDGVSWEHAHGTATVAVRGPVVELLMAMYQRRPVPEAGGAGGAAVELLGDRDAWTDWLTRTAF